ncbi:somatostatin receptor type 5-like [Bactrocera tryoni]|uniref:somatostatin receptor type 5-like n=1 Tax=Bactrocera tryoni TaxID=59916 RepID=UPI001A984A48|nr:somatostatin receptor type 5-like [Bactrocera tryoni]XP_039966818.1 somatostatin receptor type 5-like [Bactrocera tryoni]
MSHNIVTNASPDEPQIPTLALFPLEEAIDSPLLQNLSTTMAVSIENGTYNTTMEYSYYENCPTNGDSIGHIVNFVLYVIVCVIGLFGNTLVIYVVLRYSKMQTITNVYILNLAVADECFLIGIPFLLHTIVSGSWQFGNFMCKAYMVSTSITQFTSSIFLLIMSADRYIAVCHPISSTQYRTPLISKLVSGFAWLTSALLMLPVIIFANTVEQNGHISCHIKWPELGHHETGFTFIMYVFTLGFATPLIFILCFYYLVIRKLRTVGPQNKSKEKKRSHRKVTRLVLTVITVYILCWLPFWISQLILITTTPSPCATRLEIAIFLLVGCLGYSNSAMNPFLYAFLSENFKKSFRKAFAAITALNAKDTTFTASGTGTVPTAELHSKDISMFSKLGKKSRKLAAIRQQRQKQKEALLGVDSNTTTLLTNTTYGTAATATTMTVAETSETLPTEITNANPTLVACCDNGQLIKGDNTTADSSTLSAVSVVNTAADLQANGAVAHANAATERPPVLRTDL